MTRLNRDDLSQMNRDYFQALDFERLVEVAGNLHQLAVEQWERLEQNSSNSSRPPSSDNPHSKKAPEDAEAPQDQPTGSQKETTSNGVEKSEQQTNQSEVSSPEQNQANKQKKKSPGKQPGAQGKWRNQPLIAQVVIPHYPSHCAACNEKLAPSDSKPYMGHYLLELEREEAGFRVVCQLHHYSALCCACGHQTKARPGEGYTSSVKGRSKNLKLQEYVLVGPVLATLVASLGIRYRMSRAKIREFLSDWVNTQLSIGTIDRCIRETGIACAPVVEKLVEELQAAEILHLDETPWYQKGRLQWLWVAITTNTAVFHIGSRQKEELVHLVTEAFVGWLVTDGYQAYRDHSKRQRCLAHLIRKALALSGAVEQKAAQIGQWILTDLKDLIRTIAQTQENPPPKIAPLLGSLNRVCHLGERSSHPKLRALAREILNDWDAVVAFVKNPGLPPTNNEAERALRHAVIARSIGYGTRTTEGSCAYSSLLSVIETCRLRKVDPWLYIAEVIAKGRQGIYPPPIPVTH